MYISRMVVDRFGIVHTQNVPDISPGLAIFHGRNEAGKSTCLRFFQAMLFGYKRGNRSLDPLPERRGKTLGGGSLFLRTQTLGDIVLTRTPGAHGGQLSLAGEGGRELGPGDFQRLLSGLTVDVFDNIFTLTLRNLMELSALKGDSVRHALHGAAFGLGLQSPARVLKEIEERMAALLKRDPASAAINNGLRDLLEIQEEITARGPDMQQYRQTQEELDRVDARLSQLGAGREEADLTARRVQRRISVWRQWEEVRRVQSELAVISALPEWAGLTGQDEEAPLPEQAFSQAQAEVDEKPHAQARASRIAPGPVFTPDSLQRLETLHSRKEDRLLTLQAEELALARLETEIQELAPASFPVWLPGSLYDEVQTLREQKDRRQTESLSLPSLMREITALDSAQKDSLARLGSAWDTKTVAGADTSLFAKEAVHQSAAAMAEHAEQLRHVRREEDRLGEEADNTRKLARQAGANLARCPAPPDNVPEPARLEELAAMQARARDALRELPVLLRLRQETAEQAARVLTEISPDWGQDDLDAFDTSLRARQHMLETSAALQAARRRRDESAKNFAAAQGQHALLLEKAESGKALLARENLPGEATLEQRRTRIRQLERISVELAAARKDYEKANNKVSNLVAPLQEEKSRAMLAQFLAHPALPFAGGLCILAGLCLVSFDAWRSSAVLTLGGVTLILAGGMLCLLYSKTSPSPIRPEEDAAPLLRARSLAQSRKEALEAQVRMLAEEAAPWFVFETPEEPREGEIARALRLLEQQGQRLALQERDSRDIALQQAEVAAAAHALAGATRENQNAEADLARNEEAWRELVTRASLPVPTTPEAAGGLFDRVESARSRADTAKNAVHALERAVFALSTCLRAMREEPFFTTRLVDSPPWEDLPARFALFPASPPTAALLATQTQRLAPGAAEAEAPYGRHTPETTQAILTTLEAALAELGRGLAAARAAGEDALRREALRNTLAEREDAARHLNARLEEAHEAARLAQAALSKAEADWEAWLHERALPLSLRPKTALEAVDIILEYRHREQALTRLREQAQTLALGLEGFMADVAGLAHKAQFSLPSSLAYCVPCPAPASVPGGEPEAVPGAVRENAPENAPAPGTAFSPKALADALLLLDALARWVEEAARAGTLRAEKEEQRAGRLLSLAGARAALEVTERDIASLLQGAGARDAEVFRAAFARWEQRERLLSEERFLLSGIHALAQEEGIAAEEALASLRHTTLDALEGEHSRLASLAETHAEEQRTLTEERGKLRERQHALVGGQGNAPLRAKEAMLREELRGLSRQWSVLALAREFLLTAKARFEEEGQEGVIRFAGDIFASITEGEYTGIAASLEGDAFTALHHSGDRRDPERQLSQGTREQLYLALRLAYVKNHAAKAEALPLFMDDILVNFDPRRAEHTARVLADFALENQALFFTCHPGTVEILLHAGNEAAAQKGGPAPALFAVDRGEIRAGSL